MTKFNYRFILLLPDSNHTQLYTLSLLMGYNSAHVIIGDQPKIDF